MEIYPENLGPELGAAVRRHEPIPTSSEPRSVPYALSAMLLTLMLVFIVLTGFLVAGGQRGIGFLCGFLSLVILFAFIHEGLALAKVPTGQRHQHLSFALTAQEVQRLDVPQTSPFLRSYLNLAMAVIQTDVSDPEAQQEVRAALQTLGTTMFALPTEDPNIILDDPARLHAEAARLFDEADAEPDAVIGASLRRRAESQARRADTAAKTSLLLRRNQALRQETAEQMEALKTSLTAFRVGGQPSVPELADLAAGIQRVAREANAITEARAEVGTLLATPGRLREDTEPIQRQSVGG